MIRKSQPYIANIVLVFLFTSWAMGQTRNPMAPQKLTMRQRLALKTDVLVKGIAEGKPTYIRSILADSVKIGNRFWPADSVVELLLFSGFSSNEPGVPNSAGKKQEIRFRFSGAVSISQNGVDSALVALPIANDNDELPGNAKISGNKSQLEIRFSRHRGIWKAVSLDGLRDVFRK